MSRGILQPFQVVLRSLCAGQRTSTDEVRALYQSLKGHPLCQDFCNGGQHDCKELIEVLIDVLHTELSGPPAVTSHPVAIEPRRGAPSPRLAPSRVASTNEVATLAAGQDASIGPASGGEGGPNLAEATIGPMSRPAVEGTNG